MGKVEIRIPHVTWRDGRPRFIPGTVLRKAGYKGRDLKHADGCWLSLDETIAWSEAFTVELAGRRQARAEGKRVRLPRGAAVKTVGETIDALFALPTFRTIEDAAERDRREALAPKTIAWYRGIADLIAAYDPELWASPAQAVSRVVAKGFRRKAVADKGLTTARAMVAVLRRAFGEIDHIVAVNPWRQLGMKTPKPRLNAAEPEAIDALIAAADWLGRHDVGDAIMLGVCTGQRQNDRLALTEHARIDGEILFRQMKTGAVVTVPPLARLTTRIDAARARRAGMKVQWPHVVVDEKNARPWPADDGDYYRKTFARVRASAVAGVKDAESGAWILAPCPALAGFRDQDLRDTAVTWLARAGCTVPEICSITGHQEATAYTILKHYLGRHPELARNAMAKVAAWLDARGM